MALSRPINVVDLAEAFAQCSNSNNGWDLALFTGGQVAAFTATKHTIMLVPVGVRITQMTGAMSEPTPADIATLQCFDRARGAPTGTATGTHIVSAASSLDPKTARTVFVPAGVTVNFAAQQAATTISGSSSSEQLSSVHALSSSSLGVTHPASVSAQGQVVASKALVALASPDPANNVHSPGDRAQSKPRARPSTRRHRSSRRDADKRKNKS